MIFPQTQLILSVYGYIFYFNWVLYASLEKEWNEQHGIFKKWF